MMETQFKIKSLLDNYKLHKQSIEMGVATKEIIEDINFIDVWIKHLSNENKQRIIAFYLQPVGRSRIAKTEFVCRSTIYKRINKIIKDGAFVYDNMKERFPQ